MENTNKRTDTWWKKVKQKVSRVWKCIKLPFTILNWVRKHWKNALLVGIFAVGLAMMFGASFRLHGAQLVTVLVVVGILMAFAYLKMAFDSALERARKAEESQDLARKLEEKDAELAQVKTELDDERNKRVKVLGIQLISEIGLLEAECEVTKFFDRYFDKDNKEIGESVLEQKGPGPHKGVKRFLGALTAKFKAKYGIDRQKVLVKQDDQAKTIYVAGAEPSFIGPGRYPQMRWEGSVALKRTWLEGNWSTDIVDSPKLELECREKYREALQKSLENGPEQLEWVKEPLKNHIKLLLKRMIAPPGYSVRLVENADEDFTPLKGPDELLLA